MSPVYVNNDEFDLELYGELEVGECPLTEAVLLPADGGPMPQSLCADGEAGRTSSDSSTPFPLSAQSLCADGEAGRTSSVSSSARRTAPWDPRLLFDLAIGVDSLPEILARFGLTEEDYARLSEMPLFRRDLAMAIREVRAEGVSFAARAKVQAEEYLEVLDSLVYDQSAPASTRLDAIKSAVLWGRLLPKENKSDTTNATQVIVNISL
jgi:hypothetical protein